VILFLNNRDFLKLVVCEDYNTVRIAHVLIVYICTFHRLLSC